jgi:hypothetical protein
MDSIRITLRVPQRLAFQMDVRARIYGHSINEEYIRALEKWCAGMEWVETLIPAADVHDWITDDEILQDQFSPIVVERKLMDGEPLGIVLRGRAITLRRAWFTTPRGFDAARKRLVDGNVPLISTAGASMDGAAVPEAVAVYGYLDRPTPPAG